MQSLIFKAFIMRFLKLIFFLIWLVLIGCNQDKTAPELIEIFNKNKKGLGLVITELQDDKSLDSLFQIGPYSGLPPIKDSYPAVYDILNKAGITDASSHKNVFPSRTNWYYFKTNWPNEYPIYLIFNAHNSYDSSEFKNGFYSKDEVSNETWGLGDHWKMFRLVKEKTMKQ
jgi:hypothetical protein